MAELHRAGLLHRDIKPDNIVAQPDGSPALIDFGAVALFGRKVRVPTAFVGTAIYVPLEQFEPSENIGRGRHLGALDALPIKA